MILISRNKDKRAIHRTVGARLTAVPLNAREWASSVPPPPPLAGRARDARRFAEQRMRDYH